MLNFPFIQQYVVVEPMPVSRTLIISVASRKARQWIFSHVSQFGVLDLADDNAFQFILNVLPTCDIQAVKEYLESYVELDSNQRMWETLQYK